MFAVIYVPQFSLQAVLRHEPDLWTKPVALIDPTSRQPIISEVTDSARAAGVFPALTPTQAMARCGHILVRSRSIRQETAASNALLQCAYSFSPHLEATAPGLCTMDLRGLAALSGADREALERWATKLQQSMASIQLAVSVGQGPTPNVARHAACWGGGIQIVKDAKAFIASLPIAALEPSSDVALVLKRWGIRTVGEVLALGEEPLSARLGLEALALFAAASSAALRPLRLVHPSERFEESFDFEPEVETVQPVLFLLRRFVDQFNHRLEPQGLVAGTLVLRLTLATGEKLVARLHLPQPTRHPDVLFRTLHTHLESVRADSPVKSVALTVLPTQEEQKQLGLFETILSDPHQFEETLARLVALLGPDRVGTPALENTHRPDSFHLAAPDFENAPTPAEHRPSAQADVTPIRRFRPAIKAEVDCAPVPAPAVPGRANNAPGRSAQPVAIRCAIALGNLKILVGPWKASGNWWDPGIWEREEWDAATADGQVIRLVHQPDGWFVEGVID